MKRFFPSWPKRLPHSVLLRVAAMMSVLALLSLGSILISTHIADDISGRANAVNVSGSLRMLSFRALSEAQAPETRLRVLTTVDTFEQRLLALERFVLSKSDNAPSVRVVSEIVARWNSTVKPMELRAARGDASAIAQMGREIPEFVAQIDGAVQLIENDLESKAAALRIIQLGLLAGILLVALCMLWLLHTQLLGPLAQLLAAARAVSRGSFAVRVVHVADDELGQLGRAFNAMVTEIASMYANLEKKVDEKTLELTRTNEALELLYRISQKLSASDLTIDKLGEVLREVEQALGLGHSMLCISENPEMSAHNLASDLSAQERHQMCGQTDCVQCFSRAQTPLEEQGRDSVLVVPLGDGDQLRGVMPILLKTAAPLPREHERIVETVGHHVSNALISMRRTEEKHRLAALEERSAIARELHDSIAQSLSYLKIQVMRLEKCLEQGGDAQPIAQELRLGLARAYHELRELIVTFRLRIDERGFNAALQETVAEYSTKLGYAVGLSNHLSGIVLSGNEEMHVIRIIREALANVERHARARSASVTVSVDALHVVTVTVMDDGRGFQVDQIPSNHFGVNIMRDRAQILEGRLDVDSLPAGGTTVTLTFLPFKVRQFAAEVH